MPAVEPHKKYRYYVALLSVHTLLILLCLSFMRMEYDLLNLSLNTLALLIQVCAVVALVRCISHPSSNIRTMAVLCGVIGSILSLVLTLNNTDYVQ